MEKSEIEDLYRRSLHRSSLMIKFLRQKKANCKRKLEKRRVSAPQVSRISWSTSFEFLAINSGYSIKCKLY